MKLALEGPILASRLKEDDKKIVRDLTKSKVHPRNSLLNLKSKRQDCMTNIKQVYNERQQIWKSNRGHKTVLQFLISKLEEHNYVYFSRTQSESTTIEDIFWAHPTSVKLFNNFSTILVMDSTYKTNMYKMPMFEIVGVTQPIWHIQLTLDLWHMRKRKTLFGFYKWCVNFLCQRWIYLRWLWLTGIRLWWMRLQMFFPKVMQWIVTFMWKKC